MLLDAIKEITNGRIVVGDAPPIIEEDIYKGKHYKIWSEGLTYFGKVDGIVDYFSASNIIQLKKNIKEVISETKDSQYTKSEYQERLTSLNNQLSQAKQLGDSEEAKEIQKEIDELKALESGVQDKEDTYNVFAKRDGKKQQFNNKPLNSKEADELVREIENGKIPSVEKGSAYRMSIDSKASDTEAKITDLTEKAKAARAQGYAADQYEAEIEKLKAKDKKTKDESTKNSLITEYLNWVKKNGYNQSRKTLKQFINEKGYGENVLDLIDKNLSLDSTKDSPTKRDIIENQIDKLEDELEKELRKSGKNALTAKIEAQIDSLEEKLDNTNDAYDEVDWLTLDPLTEKGKEILVSMKKEYGDEQGEKIFYASKNAGKITGIDSK